MADNRKEPVIAFVWRPREIDSSVVEMARRTSTVAIFDLSSLVPESVGGDLLKADLTAKAVDLKISPHALLDSDLEDFLKEIGINRVWTELNPTLSEEPLNLFLDRIVQISKHITVIPVVSDVDLIDLILNLYPGITNLALKGSEASGFVGSETIFTLYSSVRSLVKDRNTAPDLFIWGGVATPEAAAAFLSTGARGVVFESVHWLTDLPVVETRLRNRLANLSPHHTDLVGLNLGVPCRLFNKGNSTAIKKLKSYAGSLCGTEITDEKRRLLANRISREAVEPLESQLGREELIFLGVEAAFANTFAGRYGTSTEAAVEGFVRAISDCCQNSSVRARIFEDSAMAMEMGTVYPFIQGAMSWITDVPEFAFRIAVSGGLPTIALGLMDADTLEQRLGRLPEVMKGIPYAVNVITLPENPFREVHLAWIRRIKPRFAVIAAGEPSHAAELIADGIDVIYIAPNEELLKLAFEAGVNYVICEGHEAGGHVGQYSTMTLAQTVLEARRNDPSLFKGRKIILAGGIFNRETAFMAAMLGADAIQMGTAYLATAEIVETGALTHLYQRKVLDAALGSTVVTGEVTGLQVRSLKTPKIDALCSLERDFTSGSEDEMSFRRRIEAISAGSLFIAARGLDRPGGRVLDESSCLQDGQFMSGACACALNEVRTVSELHQELAKGHLAPGLPFKGPLRNQRGEEDPVLVVRNGSSPHVSSRISRVTVSEPSKLERFAVTAMSVINSLGDNPYDVLRASLEMRSGISTIPLSRWDHSIFYDPRPRVPEKTYCKVGAFIDLDITRKELGIPPQDFRTMTGATKITMWLANKVIDESRIVESDIPRDRIGVLISQNSGEAAGTLQDMIIRCSTDKIISAVKRVMNLSAEAEKALEYEVKSGRIGVDDTTLLGRLNCSAGGFICNKYGFTGPSFSVSAACATSLVALYSAIQMMKNGIIDAAIVGGGEEYLSPMHFLEFSALGALAGLSGVQRAPAETSRPFEANRDGMVLGEGGGMIVIERESVARRRGIPAHAYIVGMGASNNNLGMVESSRETQEIAIRASFKDTPYGPQDVDLVECHATGTRQGDGEEVRALNTFFDSRKKTIITSFKSQIGHTLGASGINSLIRGIMAMNAGTFPPTLNYDNPDPEIDIDDTNLAVLKEPAEWEARNGRPRRLQVNAFGFGGSNYVVQVERAVDGEDTILTATDGKGFARSDGASQGHLPEGIFLFRGTISEDEYRVAVLAETEQAAMDAIERSEALKNGVPILGKRLKALERQGIYLGLGKQPPTPLAFVFPGQGSHYAGMGHELYQAFPIIREWMDRAAEVADFDILHLLFYDSEEDLQKTRWQQPALFTLEYAMVQYLISLGIHPTAMAGHSLGELTALCLAGVYSFEDGFRLVNMRAVCMDKACDMNPDPGVMLACDAPMDVLKDLMSRWSNIYITNVNSPRQVVIGGGTDEVTEFGSDLKKLGFRSTLLRVSMAFHSPIMRCIHDELEEFVSDIEFRPPSIPVISNTTMQPFPYDLKEIKRIVMAHLESPVQWMHNIRTLWHDYGVRFFIEVGPREILSNLILDTFDDADCIQTCLPSAEVMIYKTALAQLYARGHLQSLETPCQIRFLESGKNGKLPDNNIMDASVQSSSRPTDQRSLENIVQREINTFVMESFGRFIRPKILDAIRNEHDPEFTKKNLNDVLEQMSSSTMSTQAASSKLAISDADAPRRDNGAPPITDVPPEEIASLQAGSSTEDITETIIRLIMEATGYERDEIEPDMDLREDLSIRSSRLPVIMDSVEGHFGIKIELEDFMDVRTIRDISNRISMILARDGHKPPLPKTGWAPQKGQTDSTIAATEEKPDVKRVLFSEVSLIGGDLQPVELRPTEPVIIVSARGGTGLRRKVGDIFRRDYGADIVLWTFMRDADETGDDSFDLRTPEGSSRAAQRLHEAEPPAGLVFILDDMLEKELGRIEEIPGLLQGFFSLLKTFTESSAKKFVLLIHKTDQEDSLSRLLAEGVLGMFLSAALEFGYVQFRTVSLDTNTNLSDAIRGSLDRSRKPLETIYRAGEVFTTEGRVQPSTFYDSGGLSLGPDDVVIFSGGGYGITHGIARGLIPYGCKMVLLGRTALDPQVDFTRLLSEKIHSGEAVADLVDELRPGLSGVELERDKSRIARALGIVRNVEDLRAQGIDASYYCCDVTDPEQTNTVMDEIFRLHGNIAGVVHGAGILRDDLIREMEPDNFSAVVNVKFLGAWNLFRASRNKGIRFFSCLSSAASIQGNPGQANYAAANRAMSALMSHLRRMDDSIQFKALILPPIEGAGMADDPEIRALMKRMNAGYIHVDELSELFCRELLISSSEDVWVLFMRTLPELSTVRLDISNPSTDEGKIQASTVSFDKEDFPLIDSLSRIDMLQGELSATRTFSHERDLWISDHKPFSFLRYPLVSAIMALETFMEAARILYPHLQVRGVRDAWFLDIIECPPNTSRSSEICCRKAGSLRHEIFCEASISTQEISPSGRIIEPKQPNYKALVVLSGQRLSAETKFEGFPEVPREFETPSMDHSQVVEQYRQRSQMQGRYRVIESVDGTSLGIIRGQMIYRESNDFCNSSRSNYQYSPYLLEALMQLANFYILTRNPSESRSIIPYKIGEVIFSRNCKDGENVTVEGFLKKQDDEGIVWDARGVDEEGRTIMEATNIMFRWFST
ncbi:MAG: SDR family NAD(P)-dependent oxidoreductase [Desulfomonile sp.]